MKASNGLFFIILDVFIFVCSLCILSGFIVWIWTGWYYGWRTLLSGIIGEIGCIVLKSMYLSLIASNAATQKQPSVFK